MCLAQGPQHSDAGEARTCGPKYVSGKALRTLVESLGLSSKAFLGSNSSLERRRAGIFLITS